MTKEIIKGKKYELSLVTAENVNGYKKDYYFTNEGKLEEFVMSALSQKLVVGLKRVSFNPSIKELEELVIEEDE